MATTSFKQSKTIRLRIGETDYVYMVGLCGDDCRFDVLICSCLES